MSWHIHMPGIDVRGGKQFHTGVHCRLLYTGRNFLNHLAFSSKFHVPGTLNLLIYSLLTE